MDLREDVRVTVLDEKQISRKLVKVVVLGKRGTAVGIGGFKHVEDFDYTVARLAAKSIAEDNYKASHFGK